MNEISQKAFKFAKKQKKEIIKQFIGDNVKSEEKPVFMFMAGAPGAGKTETSKWLIKDLMEKGYVNGVVRVDADEVRDIFKPLGYNGKNSDIYKRGCIKGVDILVDNCIKNNYNTIIDGTFSSLGVATRNIESAIKIGASIFIVYVFQDPLVAWGFTKIREKEEGRSIGRDMFVNSTFRSISNVDAVKKKYGKRVEVWFVEKDISNSTKNIKFNIDSVDKHVKLKYNDETLKDKLYEESR